MNRQSTKKALLIPFVIMIITAIVLMGEAAHEKRGFIPTVTSVTVWR